MLQGPKGSVMQCGFDFHIHSYYSYDAHLSPEQIFSKAQAAGLRALAIADHHNMDGFAAFRAAAEAHPSVRWVPAMEISAGTQWGEFDVVALGLPEDAPDRLADVIDRYRRWMRDFNRCLLAGLAALGVPFGRSEADEMLATWRPGPGRDSQGEVRLPNRGLRPWLAERGYIRADSEFGEFMSRALNHGGGRPALPRAEEVLPRFRQLGAVLLLAHPQRFLEDRGEEELARLLDKTGMDGIEAGHTAHTPEQASAYFAFARRRGLLVSGGTDTHFPAELDHLGRHLCDQEAARPLMQRLGL